MDVQDHTTHTTPSGHENHGVHLCHRCGWQFPNPHPSAKHRRAHKKICGTIEGYTTLIGSEVVSDDEHHADDDKEKTPSPKIDKKMSIDGGDGEIRGSFSRSEDEFADAVTEFADSGSNIGSVNKSLDRDLFFSFKDADNTGTDEVLNYPTAVSKVDASIEVSEKTDAHVEKTEETEIKTVGDSSESNLELTGTGDVVKDGLVGPAPEPNHVSQSQEAKSIDVTEAVEGKGQDSNASETITEEAKDSEIAKMTPEVSANGGGYHDNVKQENSEKLESVTTDGISEDIQQEIKDSEITKTTPEVSTIVGGYHDNVKQEKKLDSVITDGINEEIQQEIKDPEITKTTPDAKPENFEKLESVSTYGTGEETKQEIKSDCEHVSEAVKESETVEEIKIKKSELDLEIAPEVVKGSETDHFGGVGDEIKHEKFKSDHKHVPEVAKESEIDQHVSVLNEKVDLGGPNEQIQDVVKEPVAVLTETKDLETSELDKSSREQIQEAMKEPVAVLIEKEDFGGLQLEKQSTEHINEVVEKPDSILTEKDNGTPELEGSSKEQIQEAVKEPVAVLIEKEDLGGPQLEKQSTEHTHEIVEKPDSILTEKETGAPELEGSSKEQFQEAVKEPVAVLIEKEDLGGPQLEKQSMEHTHEVVEKPESILSEVALGTPELEESSKEQIQEVVKEPDTFLTEKEDLGEPHLEKQPHEVVEKPDSVLTEKQDLGAPELKECTKEKFVEEPDSVLTEKEDVGAHKSENCSKVEVMEQKVNNNCDFVADVSTETVKLVTLKDSSDNSMTASKDASDVVPESVVEEGNGKLMNNQDSVADLTVDSSSHNSLEGNWGSVSVLSTASIDAETLQSTEKSKVNSGKSNAATSDDFEPPSFMTLVEQESKDQKSGFSELQDSQPQPNSEALQAGWFPTLTNVNNESEERKRNEEAIAKVTNWSTAKQSTPLKNLLGEARSPSGKQPEPVVQKDEAMVNPPVNDEVSSPPKLIEDDKNGRKKVKSRSSWVPFACCSSINVK